MMLFIPEIKETRSAGTRDLAARAAETLRLQHPFLTLDLCGFIDHHVTWTRRSQVR